MYNTTGYITESWDTPTPLSNCHHWCLSRNACIPRGTRPFVMYLRPESLVRMRHLGIGTLGMHSAVRGPRPGIQGFLRMLRSPTGWRRVTWKRRQGASCSEQDLNVIEFTHIKMPIRIGYVWES